MRIDRCPDARRATNGAARHTRGTDGSAVAGVAVNTAAQTGRADGESRGSGESRRTCEPQPPSRLTLSLISVLCRLYRTQTTYSSI